VSPGKLDGERQQKKGNGVDDQVHCADFMALPAVAFLAGLWLILQQPFASNA
jgi:hypothetical protein